MSTSSQELARRIARLERLVGGASEQLGHSSLEDAAINEYQTTIDENGDGVAQLTSIIGRQYDGTHGAVTVAGPTPPTPAGAELDAEGRPGLSIISTPGGVVVVYRGTWAVPFTVAPMDFSHFEIHVSDDPIDFDADTAETLRGTINTARGGPVVVPWVSRTPLYARVVARSNSGKASEPSTMVGPVTSGALPQIFQQDEEPDPLGPEDSGVWWDTDSDNAVYMWDGTAWVFAPYGTGAIGPNSLVASQVLATQSITAPLLAAVIILATELIGGNPAGPHAKMSGEGFLTYGLNPDDEVVRTGGLGTGDDVLSFLDPISGQTTFSLDRAGNGSVRTWSVGGVDADGDGVADSGFTVYGREIMELIGGAAGGEVASSYYNYPASDLGTFASGITTPFGLVETSFTARGGREYLVLQDGFHFSCTSGAMRVLLTLRGTTDGSTPTISNGQVYASKFMYIPAENVAYSAPPLIAAQSWPDGTTVRLLMVVERWNNTIGTLSVHNYGAGDRYNAPLRFKVIDIGASVADTFLFNDGGGVRSGGNPSPVAKKTYRTAWLASFVGSYRGDGTRRTDTTDMVQGFHSSNGTQRAIAGFMGGAAGGVAGELGKTVAAALAGATISKVEIALRCNHTYVYAGGSASIGYHGNTSAPATMPSSAYGAFSGAFFKPGERRWFTLPSSTFASWLNGTYRGITVGPTGDYMRFDGTAGSRPVLQITYTR